MSELRIVPALPAHLALFAQEFTDEEESEARALGMPSATASFAYLLEGSLEAWTGLKGERVGFMLGVRERAVDGEAQLWFHSVRYFAEHGMAFGRRARGLVAELLERRGTLHALLDAKRPAMRRMLTWLGFEIAEAVQLGPLGQVFHPAVLRRT